MKRLILIIALTVSAIAVEPPPPGPALGEVLAIGPDFKTFAVFWYDRRPKVSQQIFLRCDSCDYFTVVKRSDPSRVKVDYAPTSVLPQLPLFIYAVE